MSVFSRLLISFLLVAGFISPAFSQAARSPFSSLGIGEQYGNGLANNQGMAGVGVSNPQYYYLNNKNPALLVYNRFTVFEGGMILEKRTARGDSTTEKNLDGNLNYLIMGFPIKPGKWTTSAGLMPYSNVNYLFNYKNNIEGSTNTVDVTEEGSGGINQLFWSNGVSLHKNLSVGLKAVYLFSSIINESINSLTNTNQQVLYYPTIYERTYVKDFNFSLGISYRKDSLTKKNHRINFGAVYDFKSLANAEVTYRLERRPIRATTDSVTLETVQGHITLPQAFSAGISYSKGYQWTVGADFTYFDYKQYRGFDGEAPSNVQNAMRMALGFEYTPDLSSPSNYLKRMTYRTGVSFDNYPYLVNNSKVKDFGINFGISLPVSRISSLDIAIKIGKRGDLQTNTIEEKYIKLYFGATFNDQWFIKRKFD